MRKQFLAVIVSIPAILCAGCGGIAFHRVPPGQSLNVALAKKAIALEQQHQARQMSGDTRYAAVEPELPSSETEKVADLITIANFCTEAGKPNEAIAAYEEAVKLKPDFAPARYNLAVLYQQVGEGEKAAEAFRKFKELAKH